jgi:hypothetical protein
MIPHSRKVADSRHKLDNLEQAIRLLKIEFDKFFNGATPIPPEELRTKVQKQLQRLRTLRMRTFADRFRLTSLETRLNVFNELWNRRLREMDRTAQRRPATQTPGTRAIDPAAGINLEDTASRAQVEALYNELYSSSGRRKKTDFDSFRSYLDTQITKLRAKTGCDQVQFRVSGNGNRLKLKAKPIRRDTRPEGSRS